jgi:phenylpropionate dioxygenase-like ring-hydroxylating dioxygenase large terminal subunit
MLRIPWRSAWRGDVHHDERMRPSDIVLPEVVVTAEDPAIGIIRRAIANKQRWIDRLASYEMQAFTRQTIYRDTAVAAINESFTKGYWQKGDTLREIVTQKRQTANVQPSFNFASVGRMLNFSDDRINFVGYTFVGPTAVDALDYYDYKLLRTRSAGGNDVYEIRMIPRTLTAPAVRRHGQYRGRFVCARGGGRGAQRGVSDPFHEGPLRPV